MRVYQCIHKYAPHIPQFERKYGIDDNCEVSFEELRRLVIEDGYASSYILLPALENKPHEVFYTIWDYERLQHLWAKENGLSTRDLDEIKLAQVKKFKPDVFYNMSAVYDNNFVEKLRKTSLTTKMVYWNAIIEEKPRTFLDYDGHISLHRPYIECWKRKGLMACELQPAIPEAWLKADNGGVRNIDVLFYGQYDAGFFNKRAEAINTLLDYGLKAKRDIRVHLQYITKYIPAFQNFRAVQFVPYPPESVQKYSLPPIYASELYQMISRSKIVINGYTDCNHDFKSNMRLFESIGNGAFLISENGTYPDGFEPGKDFYTYTDPPSMLAQIERVLDSWTTHAKIAQRTRKKIGELYNKQRQWASFKHFISSLRSECPKNLATSPRGGPSRFFKSIG